ncbi:uncharacterized protein LACBIDRAFT_333176 [Laccaria bicolor S238N-H82]|uniref:Predicted protein n=1 Tax=Laccaria bicolor (strain S238N-H82 / ATCC MYA-4686) TaxID=486041 RepID=B0DV51_LACBS|nr:uncharacterized protein LACBIDRAFT_333176 [Laccaria bicolor S238N-H82]EDR01518.1 predicted protein [Laccaria bicolor S238N-H82]|eukprot:XP_001887870.1 predicted protein [Laccaria bicolor S238N-H82]
MAQGMHNVGRGLFACATPTLSADIPNVDARCSTLPSNYRLAVRKNSELSGGEAAEYDVIRPCFGALLRPFVASYLILRDVCLSVTKFDANHDDDERTFLRGARRRGRKPTTWECHEFPTISELVQKEGHRNSVIDGDISSHVYVST